MVCMVCDGGYWRAATLGEMGDCQYINGGCLNQSCTQGPCARFEAYAAPRGHKTCEPWTHLYCDHVTGWRFPRSWWELQQSYYLPITHYGLKCWFEIPPPPHQMPQPMPK